MPLSTLLAQTAPVASDVLSPYAAGLVSLGGFGLMFLLMFFGYLVPKTRHEEVKTERNEYKQVSEDQRVQIDLLTESIKTLVEQVKMTIEQGKTTNHLLEDIKARSPRSRS